MKTVVALTLLVWATLIAFVRFDPLVPPLHTPGVMTFTQAEFVMSDEERPPAAGWQSVTLPDNWRTRLPDTQGAAWYRVRFAMPTVPEPPQAIYLPRLAVAGELWLNGALLTTDSRMGARKSLVGPAINEPVYVTLPSSAFREGDNMLEIHMRGVKDVRSGISAIRLGPVPLLEPVWMRQYMPSVILPYALGILLAAAVCLAYAYAHRRRQYMLIAGSLAIAIFSLLLDMVPIPWLMPGDLHGVRAMVFVILYWALCRAGVALCFRPLKAFGGFLNGLLLVTLAAMAWQIIAYTSSDKVWGWMLPFVLAQGVIIALVIESAWQQRSLRLALLALCASIWNATVLQGLSLSMGWLPDESFRYNSASAIPLCLMVLLFFGERFVLDREESQREQRRAIALERARILQDMHDGMGAQLITAKRLALRPEVDRNDLAMVIDESLQDLRLIIDSLDIREGDLLPLLGNLRFRLEPRLAALGIKLSWEAQPVPALDTLSPAGALAILRIVQESLNNALRHAQPTQVRLVIAPDEGDLLIKVIDDGKGFVPEQVGTAGRGLQGIRLRAQRLGIALEIVSRPGEGTMISLRVPARPRT